jgi:hypothetical protein
MPTSRLIHFHLLAGCLLLLLSACGTLSEETSPAIPPGEPGEQEPLQPSQVAAEETITPLPLPTDLITPTPPNIDTILSDVIGKLDPGMMVYNPPENMKQFSAQRIELRILHLGSGNVTPGAATQTAAAGTLTSDLAGSGTPIVESLNVGTVMKARLSGDGFEIMPLHEEEQIVAGDTYTEWAWNVKALKPGEHELNLTITVKVIVDGFGEKARDIPVITRQVKVQVDPVGVTKGFISEHWEWVWTALLVPLAGWGWKVYRGRKGRNNAGG